MSSDIDYSDYSLDELYESVRSIDRDKFPDRASVLDELIKAKVEGMPAKPLQAPFPKSDVKRIHRLLGVLIDLCFSFVLSIPYFVYRGYEFTTGLSTQVLWVFVWLGGFLYLAVQVFLLCRNSQTLGKYVMSTRIENLDGTRSGLVKIVFVRILPMAVISVVPFLGLLVSGIINTLLIFGDDRRCLHDYIAQTRVCYVEK